MRSWLSTSKVLKITSFILLVILTICIACPKRQAIADDGDYPDHENNIPPYVHSIIALFDNSPTTGHCTVQDIEFWSNGISLGYADNLYNISVPAAADCVDVDIQIPIAAPSGNSVICLFNLYAFGITNVDYIEFYKQTTYQSVPVYYYTYYSNQFYWITSGQNISASAYYTLRIHIKQGGYTITRYNYANTVTLKSYEPVNNSSFQEQYTQWYYLTSLLREVDGLGISVEDLTIDLDHLENTVDSILTALQNMRYGNYKYIQSDASPYMKYYRIDSDLKFVGSNNLYSYTQTLSQDPNFTIAFPIYMGNTRSCFYKIYIPVSDYSNIFSYDVDIYCGDSFATTSSRYNSINFDNLPVCYFSIQQNGDIHCLMISTYIPYIPYVSSEVYFFIRFHTDDPSAYITLSLPIVSDADHLKVQWYPSYSQHGFELTTMGYLGEFYKLLHDIADNTQYVAPPVGSDPETNITNIYDVDVEFNNSIGDIFLFESNYQQQLTIYDTQVSSNYLIPVSEQYTFGRLNIEFQYIWSHMFSYDLDEDNNKIGVYGLGLYFLIPLILFVICALFRRVTS